jgi:hypothetical protein
LYLARIFCVVINSMQVVPGLTTVTAYFNHASTERVMEAYL